MSHERHAPAEEVLARVAELIEEAVATAGVDRERLVGVGVGASGLVDPHTGVNVLAPNLNWRNLPVGDILRDRLGRRYVWTTMCGLWGSPWPIW